MSELMGAEPRQASRSGSLADDLVDAAASELSSGAEPKGFEMGVRVRAANTEVSVECSCCAASKWQDAWSPVLAHDVHEVLLKIDIFHSERGELLSPKAGIDQEPDERHVPPGSEGATSTDVDKRAQLGVAEYPWWFFWDAWWPYVGHWRAIDLTLFHGPFEQLLKRTMTIGHGRWFAALEESDQKGFDVLPADTCGVERHP